MRRSRHPELCVHGWSDLRRIDHLNALVAPGHALIPANAVVNVGNVQVVYRTESSTVRGRSSAAVGRQPVLFWGSLGHSPLTFQCRGSPVTHNARPWLKKPHTQSFHLGLQRELTTIS